MKTGPVPGGDVAQLVRASDRHAADAGSIPRWGKGFFSQSQLSVQTLLRVSVQPRVKTHICAHVKDPVVHVRVRRIMETLKTPSIHGRLGSSTLSQLAFPGESKPKFPWEKSHWDNTVVKSQVKKKCPHSRWTGDGGALWSIKKCLVVSSARSHDLSDDFS